MKKLLIAGLMLCAGSSFAQVIPNSFFEGWNSKTTNVPQNWSVTGNIAKVSGKTGSAMRLSNSLADGTMSYTYQAGIESGTSFFGNGFGYSAVVPDSISITYKALLGADTAYLQLGFTKKDSLTPLTFDYWELRGTAGNWVTITLPVSYIYPKDSLSADSGFIFIQSADGLSGPFGSGFIDIDNITFKYNNNSAAPDIPNHGFDLWDTYTLERPDAWETNAVFLEQSGIHLNSSSKTTDKHSGSFALKIQGTSINNPFSGKPDTIPGFAITANAGSGNNFSNINSDVPAFPVTQRYQSIRGFVKSNMLVSDQITLMVNFFHKDTIVGSAVMIDKSSHSNWFEFSEDIAWDSTFKNMPDSATIAILVCDSNQISVGSLSSWAIFDDLRFDNYTSTVAALRPNNLRAVVYPNPSNGEITVRYNAEVNGEAQLRISDLNGRTLLQQTNSSAYGENRHSITLSGIPAGMYLISLETSEGIHTEKILYQP